MGQRQWLLPENGTFYKANLHSHTVLSDGRLTPQEVKEAYQKEGYSIVAYTDHRHYGWHPELLDENFIPIAAYEVDINEFFKIPGDFSRVRTYHINLYDTNPWDKPQEKAQSVLPERRYTDINYINQFLVERREAGFIACYNHPYWSLQNFDDYKNLREVWAMEIYNYGCEHDGLYGYHPQSYDEMLREGTRLYCLATDDNHNALPFDDPLCDSFGGFVMVKAKELTYASVMEALLAGDFYASMGPEIKELYLEDGKLHIKTSPAEKIYVMTEGRNCHKKVAKRGETITEAEFELWGNEGYIRVDVRDEKGRHANSNAYFLQGNQVVRKPYQLP
ncbi:MAG: PHP domain-containing protein [bacterium]|nr:PHP domain-containing protein [bacterium]